MQAVLSMKVFKGRGCLAYVAKSHVFIQRPLCFYYIGERTAVYVFHYIVGGAVLFKGVGHAHYARMFELKEGVCLVNELVSQFFYKFNFTLCCYYNAVGLLFAVAEVLYKELLYGHAFNAALEFGITRFIGDTENALAKYALYAVATAGKLVSCFKIHCLIWCLVFSNGKFNYI